MRTLIAVVLGFFVILITSYQAFSQTSYLEQADTTSDDPTSVVNRPVNVQGLTGLIITNSAYTQRRGSIVVGLSAIAENSSEPNFSMARGIATITAGVTDRIEVGAKAKVIASNMGSSDTREIGAGDTDLLFKWRLSSAGETLPAIALGLAYTIPTGDTEKGFSEVKREGIRFMVIGASEKEMPGGRKDRQLAREEGAQYQFLTQPVKFIANEDGCLAQIECIRMQLGEPDAKGRRRPVPIEGTNFIVEADTAILALGYWPDPVIGDTTPDLKTHKYGLIVTDPATGATSRPGVFAGGDDVTGPDLVVTAMVAGRKAAASIDRYINN